MSACRACCTPPARIRAIDTSRAEALPGVVTIITGADALKLPDPYYGVAIRDQPVVAINKVRYVGDTVAAVAAIDEETAYHALSLIDVDYELLPPVLTIDEALAEGAPVLFDEPVGGGPIKVGEGVVSLKEPRPNVLTEFGYRNGDADAVLAASDHVFEDRFVFSRINHFHLEPYVNIAQVTASRSNCGRATRTRSSCATTSPASSAARSTRCASTRITSAAASAAKASARWSRLSSCWR